ncbi:cilia- and flagella-associated protein 95-like [Corticium candelabrum]|uniref:cilia- and flagella-associated protein 95-like n=1 Tax=Corticium candelabrum TaxID=121492 RepID=UPI002E26C060|nr:cilia- and flagella-associated protein 95-like [Corticium candelabrum]
MASDAMDAFDPTVLPQFVERKGSLLLRSDHMKYGRGTLNSNWHQEREAEPKDYDVTASYNDRNLLKATYQRLATDDVVHETTTKVATEQIRLKKDFEVREIRKLMIGPHNSHHTRNKRKTDGPERGYGSVMPRHHPDHNKRRSDTTHKIDYKNPWPHWSPAETKNEPNVSPPMDRRFHRHQSQFTDTADHRHNGIQTWQDESGVYGNSWFTTTRQTHTVKQEKK